MTVMDCIYKGGGGVLNYREVEEAHSKEVE